MDGMTHRSPTHASLAAAASHLAGPASSVVSTILLRVFVGLLRVVVGLVGITADPGLATNPVLADDGSVAATAGSRATNDAHRRLYITGIVGSSLGGDAGPNGAGWIGDLATPTFGGDAAIGVAVDRSQSLVKGSARLEFEGRTRSRSGTVDGGRVDLPHDEWSATDWSTMANFWRDVPITDHLGAYAGGGIGAGGFHDAAGEIRSGFTWQVGGGLTYALNDRFTLDVGYRALPAAFGAGRTQDAPTGELLFSVRVYEPFRGWLRD